VGLVEDGDHLGGVPIEPPEELPPDGGIQEVVVVADGEVDPAHRLLQALVATQAALPGPLVDVVGRADAVVEPAFEVAGIGREVRVVVVAGRPLPEVFESALNRVEFLHHRAPGLGRLRTAVPTLR
jgi:hypothetical protein